MQGISIVSVFVCGSDVDRDMDVCWGASLLRLKLENDWILIWIQWSLLPLLVNRKRFFLPVILIAKAK